MIRTGSRFDWRPDFRGRWQSTRRYRELLRTGGLKSATDVDWSEHYVRLNQEGNSCLGFSRTQCVNLWLKLRGIDAPLLSPYRPYWYARRRHLQHDWDGGTYTRSIWWAGMLGDVPWDQSVPAAKLIDSPPTTRDDMRAVDIEVEGAIIYDRGQRLLDRIVDSLAKNQPVQLSLPIDEEFTAPLGPSLIDVPSDSLSLGHAVTVLGVRVGAGGELEFLIGNSWGYWRRGGTAWLTANYVKRAYGVWYVRKVKGKWW